MSSYKDIQNTLSQLSLVQFELEKELEHTDALHSSPARIVDLAKAQESIVKTLQMLRQD